MSDEVRIGVIGVGNMGMVHADYLLKGSIKGAVLTAILEKRTSRIDEISHHFDGKNVNVFSDENAFFESGTVDAVIIATPHYSHPSLAIRAFEHGIHVLVEKPAGVYTKQVREMNEEAQKHQLVFSIMYNQRMNPIYQKLRELIQDGELGGIRRINWIITDWYRTQSYYDSSSWRATWEGEGGGVLINQCPHQLDLMYWLTGQLPERIRAFCHFGKYRDIEVEDDVTAYAEYENGATAVFVTTTGEAPGTNRLEITGENGKVVVENNKLSFWRLRMSEPEFNQSYTGGFGAPETWKCEIPIEGPNTGHAGITQNFIEAILHQKSLVAPGEQGINGLTLSNAMQLSTWIDNWVSLPLDEDLYLEHLNTRKDQSTVKKSVVEKSLDVKGTH
ncbi:Gfo/Idh/MocA family protein [Alkalicoccobacillus porphyridii]|uniref:Gfo/Idh/MocA family oxidoreductase n=1 Tax=Alkalicoccobacillus porphyridii TaxID=2597270 RepID=A0A554A323_9BACI|nr:Gfo/Idh/MocA family oxidoreductase [Alkalicoccobacillus porphyridii]TSB48078.1 Gfo/Idh/MocA family oxidoreductase [Alkalicoccobacillus porphyridii]